MSKKQRLAKKASKLILELYKEGVNELDIDIDGTLKIGVFIRPYQAVTVTQKGNEL